MQMKLICCGYARFIPTLLVEEMCHACCSWVWRFGMAMTVLLYIEYMHDTSTSVQTKRLNLASNYKHWKYISSAYALFLSTRFLCEIFAVNCKNLHILAVTFERGAPNMQVQNENIIILWYINELGSFENICFIPTLLVEEIFAAFDTVCRNSAITYTLKTHRQTFKCKEQIRY